MTAIALDRVTKTYADAAAPAVRDCSLELPAGTITALLGPSGCGKTTILKLVAGLLVPTRGDIMFDGRSVRGVPAEQRQAAMVFQDHLLFPYMSVGENVAFALRMRGVRMAERARAAAAMLEQVRLAGFAPRRPRELSGGQQQRVALARALVAQPRALLLDEPLSNLDAHLRDEMRTLIRSLQRASGVTTLVVTHDQQEAVTLADRIVLLFDGVVQQVGSPRDFYTRPANAAVARFFGGVNFVSGIRHGATVQTPLGTFPAHDAPTPDGSVLLTVRPEAIQMRQGDGVPALVQHSLYLGTQMRYTVQTGAISLDVLAPAESSFAIGDTVALVIPPERVWLVEAE